MPCERFSMDLGSVVRTLATRGSLKSNVITNSNADTATVHGNAVSPVPSIQDKVIAASAVTLGALGFLIFLYFYLSPLIMHKRKMKFCMEQDAVALITPSMRLSSSDSSSIVFISRVHPAVPKAPLPIIARDSIAIAKDKRDIAIAKPDYTLLHPAIDMRMYSQSSYIPNSPVEKLQDDCVTPSALPQSLETSSVTEKPITDIFVGLPSLKALAPIVVVSESKGFLSSDGNLQASHSKSAIEHPQNDKVGNWF